MCQLLKGQTVSVLVWSFYSKTFHYTFEMVSDPHVVIRNLTIHLCIDQGRSIFGCVYALTISRPALSIPTTGCSPLCNTTVTVNQHINLIQI